MKHNEKHGHRKHMPFAMIYCQVDSYSTGALGNADCILRITLPIGSRLVCDGYQLPVANGMLPGE